MKQPIWCSSCSEKLKQKQYQFLCSGCGATYEIGKGRLVPAIEEIHICKHCGHTNLSQKK